MKHLSTIEHGIGWRVPNKVFLALSVVVVVLTWGMLLYIYSALPTTIPSHFGFSGRPDAMMAKSWWIVFFPAILQVVLVSLTWWLSYHPQYSNLPSTLTIPMIPEPTQTMVKRLLSHMLVMTGLITTLIMAYISLGTVRVALDLAEGINSWAIFGLTGLLFLIIGVYTSSLRKLTRHLPKPPGTEQPS